MTSERVRHARIYHGWSQADLAERVGTTQPKISQLEKGSYQSSELVDAVAVVTQFSRWWFDLGPLPDLPKGSLKFRKRASASDRDDERIRAHVRNAIELVTKLENAPGVPPVRLTPHTGPVTVEDIEEVAGEAREWLGVGPYDPIPNLVRAVERCGVIVIGSAVEIHKHDGASFWPDYPVGRPIVCVSRGTVGDRQRFSVGHEVGHLVLHQFGTREPALAEQEAHRFAGALLLPRKAALDEITCPVTLRSLAHIKARWGMAIRALVRRCLDLRIIDETKRVSLEKQISARGWTRAEPVEVNYENPRLLRLLLERQGLLSHRTTGLPPLAVRDLIA